MNYNIELPVRKEDDGYFEIRLESIGGLGANLCGKLLGELGANYLGFNSASFSSYGSEKRGSPVKAFIRWSRKDKLIRINSPVRHPRILGLFHDAMLGKEDVLAGVDKYTKLVINTSRLPEDIAKERCISGDIYCVDAGGIAMNTGSRINMIMLGAIARVSDFIPLEAVIELAEGTIGKKYPDLIDINILGIKRGYEEVAWSPASCIQDNRDDMDGKDNEYGQEWGYRNSAIGGINPMYGSSVSNDLSASREGYIPLFIQERCINCGLCDTTCPDMVFQFEIGIYKGREMMVNRGLDYRHCKGCLRCVDVCPVNALVTGVESEHPNPKWNRPNKDLLEAHMDYDKVGANSYVTSESYLQEKRIDQEEGVV